MILRRRFFARFLKIAASLVGVCLSVPAQAAVLAPGFIFTDFAEGFQVQAQGDGSVGTYDVATASNGTIYVSSHADGFVYHFNASDALPDFPTAGNRLNAVALSGGISGLCVSKAQRLYLARLDQGDVVELDPTSGAVLREVATGMPCASHLAQDPLSGDLFVSSVCQSVILRLGGFESSNGSVNPSVYCTGIVGPDGLGFGRDGTLYVAGQDGVEEVTGTNTAQPGTASTFVGQASVNGVAVEDGAAGLGPYVYACDSNGTLNRYDTNAPGSPPTPIFSGIQRGEGLALDAKGNLFVTQSFGLAQVDLGSGPLSGPQPTATPSVTPVETDTVTATMSPTFSPSPTLTATLTETATEIPTASISIGTPVPLPVYGTNNTAIAVSQDRMYVTKGGDAHIYTTDAQGNLAVFATIPTSSNEEYLAISPGYGGFPANHVFVTVGSTVYDVAPDGSNTLFAKLPSSSDSHYGLTFDTGG